MLAELFREAPLDREEARERAAEEIASLMELTREQVRAAIAYYLDYRDEIDEWIRANDEAAEQAHAEWSRRQELLRA